MRNPDHGHVPYRRPTPSRAMVAFEDGNGASEWLRSQFWQSKGPSPGNDRKLRGALPCLAVLRGSRLKGRGWRAPRGANRCADGRCALECCRENRANGLSLVIGELSQQRESMLCRRLLRQLDHFFGPAPSTIGQPRGRSHALIQGRPVRVSASRDGDWLAAEDGR
jgi:hypothetical protein